MHLRLTSKLILSTSGIVLITVALCAYANVTTLKRLLVAEAVSDADKLSETIIRTTHYQMLDNDRRRVYQMISEVKEQQGVERIRLINKNGLVIFSTTTGETGTILDKQAAACNMCHSGKSPLLHASSMNRSRFFKEDGKDVLGLAKAIYNEEACYNVSCHFHPSDSRILGVLDVIVSLDATNAQVAAYRSKMILLAILLMGLISLSIFVFLHSFIHHPLKQLLIQTERVARGDLEAGVRSGYRDELGDLASSFNIMTHNLKLARNELEGWGRTLEQKVEERTKELRQMQAQLSRSEKLASLGELVAGISHEINNPLTGILVFSSLLCEDPRLDPALKKDLETIMRESQRCAQIVKGLLDFSRESVPMKERASLNNIMQLTLTLIGNQAFFHDIAISTSYDPSIPDVMADPNQLEQVFVNILLNASQAMEGKGLLSICTGTVEGGGSAFVEITDTGCGISEENITKIFDPFFTTKESKGTGLGLSVSYGIIENHGGRIEVMSEVGMGTTFTIVLPMAGDE